MIGRGFKTTHSARIPVEAAAVNGLLHCRTFIIEYRNDGDDVNIMLKSYQMHCMILRKPQFTVSSDVEVSIEIGFYGNSTTSLAITGSRKSRSLFTLARVEYEQGK
jgi:hypothetical protein